MFIGYILLRDSRSPKAERANLLDLKTLVQAKCDRIYIDFERENRKQLQEALESLEAKDTLLVTRFDSLGNSQASFLEIIAILKKREIHLQSLSESYSLSPNTRLIECFNLAKKLFSKERKASLSSCQSIPFNGDIKEKGRPPLPKEQKELMRLLRLLKINNKPIKVCKLCELARVTRPTYYKFFPTAKLQKIAS